MSAWNDLFGPENEPSLPDFERFVSNPLWSDIHAHIRDTYKLKPKTEYSKCSAQPGWNIKYKKGGKPLCTLYPMEGYFIALVVVNAKMSNAADMLMPSLGEYIRDLYKKTTFICGGRWLMIDIRDRAVYKDAQKLLSVRAQYT